MTLQRFKLMTFHIGMNAVITGATETALKYRALTGDCSDS